MKGGRCFELFPSLLDCQRGVFNRFCHFYGASDVFGIVLETYIARELFLYCLSHFLDSQRGLFHRLRHFLKASEVSELLTSL